MNLKEAEEIVSHPLYDCMSYTKSEAEGFLDAWHQQEKRAEILLKTLEEIKQSDCYCHMSWKAKQALEAYENQ